MSVNRHFYASLALLILLNVVIKPLWIFGIDRPVQNLVGTTVYGSYFALLNLSIVFNFLLDWGMTAYYNRQLASQQEGIIQDTGKILGLKFLFAFTYGCIVFLLAAGTGELNWLVLTAIILIQVLTSFFLFFRAIITARQWFVSDAWLSVLDKTLMILVCGAMLLFPLSFGILTISRFVWLQAACLALSVIVALIILMLKGFRFPHPFPLFIDKSLFKTALPYALIILLMSVHYRIDGFLVERMHADGPKEAGMYASAYRLLDAANMVGFLFSSFLLPYAARQFSSRKDITSVVLTSRHLLILYSLGISLSGIFLGNWIHAMLYRDSGPEAARILQWCLPALLGYSLVNIYGTVMTATGHIRPFCYITLVAVILNIALNLLLIPSMGAMGCCIAALVSQSLCGIAVMVYVKKKIFISFDFPAWGIYIYTAVLLGILFYFGSSLALNNWFLITAGMLLVFAVIYLSRLLGPTELNQLFRKPQL